MGAKDGGPAFPVQNSTQYSPGLSLRDYAAIHADLTGITFGSFLDLANFLGEPAPEFTDFMPMLEMSARAVAKARYIYADAMLVAREAP